MSRCAIKQIDEVENNLSEYMEADCRKISQLDFLKEMLPLSKVE